MNGAHDLGGMHGFGPIDIESGHAPFHHKWEERVFAMTLACGFLGQWNIDQSRFARERMEPGEYLQTSYYEHWLYGLETLLVERGLLPVDKTQDSRAVPAGRVAGILASGGPSYCASQTPPQFNVGDTVTIGNQHPAGHTRAPRFVRGRQGTITRYHGSHVLPDISSQPQGIKKGAHLYNIRFEADALWGDAGDSNSAVYVDVFEPYIEERL